LRSPTTLADLTSHRRTRRRVRSLRGNDGTVARDDREGEGRGPGPVCAFWAAPVQLLGGSTAYLCFRRRLGARLRREWFLAWGPKVADVTRVHARLGGAPSPRSMENAVIAQKPWLDRPEFDPAWTWVTGRSGPSGNGRAGRAQDHAPVAEADICIRVSG
jgi:hypothetical protein